MEVTCHNNLYTEIWSRLFPAAFSQRVANMWRSLSASAKYEFLPAIHISLSLCVQCKHIIYSFLEARFSRFTLESRIGHPHSVAYDCTMGAQSILLQWHSYWGSFLFQQLYFSLGGLYSRQARAHLTNKETENWDNWVPVKLAQYMTHKDQRISL